MNLTPGRQASSAAALLLALALACVMLGCGPKASTRFDVSGNVSFQGKPVPRGKILFLPDGAKGNSGAAGAAAIKDGVYNTRQNNKGICGGPHIVVIIGFDGKPGPTPENIAGKPLFPEYRVNVDMPRETTNKDFVVPPAR
jgi:hypothetical protein